MDPRRLEIVADEEFGKPGDLRREECGGGSVEQPVRAAEHMLALATRPRETDARRPIALSGRHGRPEVLDVVDLRRIEDRWSQRHVLVLTVVPDTDVDGQRIARAPRILHERRIPMIVDRIGPRRRAKELDAVSIPQHIGACLHRMPTDDPRQRLTDFNASGLGRVGEEEIERQVRPLAADGVLQPRFVHDRTGERAGQ